MDNKKNTILLTVIAVATLLVAVVGATFAFFTAQTSGTAQTNVTVQTATADSSSFGTFSAITITADQENFAEGKGNRTGTSEGAVSFTASSATPAETPAEFCYSVALNVTSNNFVYSSTQTADPKLAELIFKAEKKADGATDYTTLVNNVDITTGTASVKVPNNTTCGASCGTTDYIHKITAAASEEKSDAWKLTVELVNLDVDQNDNTNKSFVGAVKFDRVNCTTGEVIPQSTPTAEEETPAA